MHICFMQSFTNNVLVCIILFFVKIREGSSAFMGGVGGLGGGGGGGGGGGKLPLCSPHRNIAHKYEIPSLGGGARIDPMHNALSQL